MPDAGHQGDALARFQADAPARLDGLQHPIAGHRHVGVAVDAAILGRGEQFDDQVGAAAVDDVLGLDVVPVHRRELVLARDHDLLGIEHALALGQVAQRAVAGGEQEQAHLVEAALAVVGDVPAHAAVTDHRGLVGADLLGRPIGEGRQDVAEAADEGVAFGKDLVDFRAFHGAASFA